MTVRTGLVHSHLFLREITSAIQVDVKMFTLLVCDVIIVDIHSGWVLWTSSLIRVVQTVRVFIAVLSVWYTLAIGAPEAATGWMVAEGFITVVLTVLCEVTHKSVMHSCDVSITLEINLITVYGFSQRWHIAGPI